MKVLKEALKTIKKRNRRTYLILSLIFIFLFIISFFSGQYLYKTDRAGAEEIVKKISEDSKTKYILNLFDEKNFFLAGFLIFINNFLINVFSMYLGIILIVPILVFLSNATTIGMLFGIESMYKSPSLLHIIMIFIVGILEISCFILTTYEGLRIGNSWIKPRLSDKKVKLKQALKEASSILVLVAIILIIAAIIETIGISIFSSGLIS